MKAPSSPGLLPSGIAGLHYLENYVSAAGHDVLLTAVDAQPWSDDLRRRVQHYGFRYDYKRRSVDRSMALGPLPDWAAELAERLGQEGITPARPDQLIVNEYLPGQGIANHIDCEPCFGGVVCSLSLGSACTMVLTHAADGRQEHIRLAPHSLLVLSGEARYEWLRAEDYADASTLHYQVWLALKAVGTSLTINFSPFRQSEGLNQT